MTNATLTYPDMTGIVESKPTRSKGSDMELDQDPTYSALKSRISELHEERREAYMTYVNGLDRELMAAMKELSKLTDEYLSGGEQ